METNIEEASIIQQSELSITYNADDMGRFHKTVSVYGNMEDSPLIIKLKGNIE